MAGTLDETVRTIQAQWDPEAKVWVAQSDDIQGLVTEAESLDELFQVLQDLVPELMRLNGLAADQATQAPFQFVVASNALDAAA